MADRISDEDLAHWSRDLSAMDGEYLPDLLAEVRSLRVKVAAMTPVVESVLHAYAQDGSFPGGTATRIEKWRRSR